MNPKKKDAKPKVRIDELDDRPLTDEEQAMVAGGVASPTPTKTPTPTPTPSPTPTSPRADRWTTDAKSDVD
jgi:hypothetical protein